jgi:hypothetical protein
VSNCVGRIRNKRSAVDSNTRPGSNTAPIAKEKNKIIRRRSSKVTGTKSSETVFRRALAEEADLREGKADVLTIEFFPKYENGVSS